MKIDVKTVMKKCADYCPDFEVITIKLICDGRKYIRSYRCKNLEKCERIKECLNGYQEEDDDSDEEI